MRSSDPNDPINQWFLLQKAMLKQGETPSAIRPPSLRDAIYAWVLAQRTDTETTPETIESYVNGLELGCMYALKNAWEEKYGAIG